MTTQQRTDSRQTASRGLTISAVFLAAGLVGVGLQQHRSGPAEEAMAEPVRLPEKSQVGLVQAPVAQPGQGVPVVPAAVPAPAGSPASCQSDAMRAKLAATKALLDSMDALMSGYVDEMAGPQPGPKPQKCLTAVAASNDPLAAKIEAQLLKQWSASQRAWEAKRAAAVRSLPTEWVWLRVWLDDHPKPLGGLKFAHEPALTKFVREGAKLDPEGDLWCAVVEAKVAGKVVALSCEAAGTKYTVLADKAAAGKGGALEHVQIGDLVKVSNHLGIAARFPYSGSETHDGWTVYDVPADGVSVAEKSTCCGAK
jgi:hypothetical protein